MTNTCDNCVYLMSELNRLLGRVESKPIPNDDHVKDFLGQHTMFSGQVLTQRLYARYVMYCEGAGIVPLAKNAFGTTLNRLGFPMVRGTAGVRYRTGLSLT